MAKTGEHAKKIEMVKAQEIKNILDGLENKKDVIMTNDFKESMKLVGIGVPIEVTDFYVETGKYMIASGHGRRTAAGKVFGEDVVLPCLEK